MDGGGRETHRWAAVVDGEAAAGSQEGRASSGGVSSPEGVGSCGTPGISSAGGAPRNGSTTVFPARSVQGKGSQGLDEAWGHVVGG
jgi:hypothetical protein